MAIDSQFSFEQYIELKLPPLDVLALRLFFSCCFQRCWCVPENVPSLRLEIDVLCILHFLHMFYWRVNDDGSGLPDFTSFSQWWVYDVLGDVPCVRLWVTGRVRVCESLSENECVGGSGDHEERKRRFRKQNTVTLRAVSDFHVSLPELTFCVKLFRLSPLFFCTYTWQRRITRQKY